MEREYSPGREMVDQATQELRRKIDEMLEMSTASADPIPQNQNQQHMLEAGIGEAFSLGANSKHNPNLQAFKMNEFEFNAPIRDEKEEIQAEVQSIIKNCLMVEDEAAVIRGGNQGRTLKKQDMLYHGEFDRLLQQPKERAGQQATHAQTMGRRQNLDQNMALPQAGTEEENKAIYRSTLNQQQKKLFNQVVATQDQETAEDFQTAMELMNRYQKDKNCFKKDLKDLQHQSALVLEQTDPSGEDPKKQAPKGKSLNPLLTQNERHRQVQEMREKRLREQQLRSSQARTDAQQQVAANSSNYTQKERNRSRQHQHKQQSQISKQSDRHVAQNLNQKASLENQNISNNTDLDSVMALSRKANKPASRQPVQATQADFQLKKVRQAKEEIDQQTREYQDEYKKVQNEIKQYKQALFEQQKALKQQQTQAEMQKILAEEKRVTEQKMAKSQKALKDFNMNRLFVTVSSIFQRKVRQQKTNAYDTVQLYSLKLKLVYDKTRKHREFRMKAQVYRQWLLTIQQEQHEKQLLEYEMRERLLMQIEQKLSNRQVDRRKLTVWKALKNNIVLQRDERQIEEQHDARKAQIDNFFANLRQKVEKEKVDQSEEKDRGDLKERVRQHAIKYAEENKHITSDNVNQAEMSPFQIDFTPSQQLSMQPKETDNQPEFMTFAHPIANQNQKCHTANIDIAGLGDMPLEQNVDMISAPGESGQDFEQYQQVLSDNPLSLDLQFEEKKSGIESSQQEIPNDQALNPQQQPSEHTQHTLNRDLFSIQTHSQKPSMDLTAQNTYTNLVVRHEESEGSQRAIQEEPTQELEQQLPKQMKGQRKVRKGHLPERPKQVQLMEERAKQRKERREQLNQRYAEKKRIELEAKEQAEREKEEEFKRKQQEEKDARKNAKLEEERQKELVKQQAEDLRIKMHAAAIYYNEQLLIKYGILPLKYLIINIRWNERRAILHYHKTIQRTHFRAFKTQISMVLMERQNRETFNLNQAKKFIEYRVFRKYFDLIKRNVIISRAELMHSRDKCQFVYQKALFEKWKKDVPELRGERLMIEVREDEKVREFRYRRFGKMFLKCLELDRQEFAIEKEKDKYKEALRNKVSFWLEDIDQKTEEEKKD